MSKENCLHPTSCPDCKAFTESAKYLFAQKDKKIEKLEKQISDYEGALNDSKTMAWQIWSIARDKILAKY